MSYGRIKPAALAAVAVAAALALTGCGGKKQKETEPPQTQAQIQTFAQTEPPTEKHTEPPQPVTERPLTMKDVQVKIKKAQRKGTFSYEIADSSGVASGSMEFQADSSGFLAEGEDKGVYFGKRMSAYKEAGGSWKKADGNGFADMWGLVYGDSCEMPGRTDIGGRQCYHVIAESDEVAGLFAATCGAEGYADAMTGEARIDFYADPDSFEIVRATANAEFQADKGSDVRQGQITLTFESSNAQSLSIVEPSTAPEVETEKEDPYQPGDVSPYSNVYRNRLFDVQIVGGDVFWFDADKTAEIAESYKASGSSYAEEAYAEGSGGILNVVSIQTNGKTKDAVLNKYMTDSGATAAQTAGVVEAGTLSYVCSTATINGAKTKTYCAEQDGRALIMTVYYTDDGTPAVFESNVYGFGDDPLWEEETWTLAGKVDVRTPKGYSIVRGESNDLYVCMESSSGDVNVFALEGRSIDEEFEKETATTADTTRDLVSDEWKTAPDGSEMRYFVVKNSDASYDYYTYVGLAQKDSVTVKYYAVSSSGDLDYSETFETFLQATGTPAPETEAPAADGEGAEGGEEIVIDGDSQENSGE